VNKYNQDRVSKQSAFTLVEMLLVVAIIGILAAVVAAKFGGKADDARIAATRASIQSISTAIDTYEVDVGRYPSSVQALVSGSGEPNWKGPYIKGGAPSDQWGTAFSLTVQGNTYQVRSAGPDRAMNTGDDITGIDG
jgi:general secretion pathway protein G